MANIINTLREKIGYYFLKEDFKRIKRNKILRNYENIRSVAILYSFEDETRYNQVCDMVKDFQNDNKVVKTLGLFNHKNIPHYCFPRLAFDHITPKSSNIYYKPNDEVTTNFIKEEFDLLINLNLDDNLALHYIATLSNSKFKVGKYDERYSMIYDFLFHYNNKKDIYQFKVEIINYLKIIKTQK